MLAEIHEESAQIDNEGVHRGVVVVRNGREILPAGSIILTGAPEGTAIEAPSIWDRARLLARANLSLNRARQQFAQHCLSQRKPMGYLSPGDVVETSIDHLGRQRWSISGESL